MIIADHAEHVEIEHAAANNNNKPIVGRLYPTQDLDTRTPSELLKSTISFRALVESDGQKLKKVGERWGCSCPFHADRTPSFFINKADNHANCYGCGWHGDIFSYVMSRTGCSFVEAIELLRNAPTLQGTKTISRAVAKSPQESEFVFSDSQLEEIAKYTIRLATDEWLIERVASSRKWTPETLQSLARTKHLGWAGDALAFIYKTGVKVREWPGKRFYWEYGQPYIWRADTLPNANRVYITEGEPDAITLIDLGLEKQEGVAVVAAPSATTFHESWVELFTGRDVILCYDLDEPGQLGVKRVGGLLNGTAKSISVWNPKEGK